MKYPIVKFWARSLTILAILLSVFIMISAISCTCKTSDNQGVVWQLDTFQLRYSGSAPNTNEPQDISPIVKPGQLVYIWATIKNVGTEAGAYEWKLYLDNAPDPFFTDTTGNLDPGSTDKIGETPNNGDPISDSGWIKTSSYVWGQHEVKIGTVTRHFTVQAPAEITAVTAAPSCIALSHADLTITAQVKNPGDNIEDYLLHLIVDGYERQTKHLVVTRLSTSEVTFFINNQLNYGCGCHNVKITADGSESQGIGVFEVGIANCPCTGTCGTATSSSPLEASTPTTPPTGTPDTTVPSTPATTVSPLALASTTLPDGVVGQAYTTDDIKPTGGITPFSYSVTAGNLPAGLRLSSFGDHFRIEGTPTEYEKYDFEITVNNANESTAGVKATFKLTVFPNLNGTWVMTTTVTEAHGVCEGEGGTRSREITVVQNGRVVTFSGFYGSSSNRLYGEILPPGGSFIDVVNNKVILNNSEQFKVYITGSYAEDSGITTSTRRLTINSASDMSGVEDWTWVGGGGNCPDGKGVITARKIPQV